MKKTHWFTRLTEGEPLRKLQAEMRENGRHIWWEIPEAAPKKLSYTDACRTCRFVRASVRNRRTCQAQFLEGFQETRRQGAPFQYACPIQRATTCFPLIRSGQTAGFLAVCHQREPLSPSQIRLVQLAIENAMAESERRGELTTLSETIQPRCVALSTVHTIHRLISSTLKLDELLPRVARLCCQVLRAESCGIWLMEREKQILQPRAAVEVKRGAHFVGRPYRLGKGLVGRIASTCKARLSAREMLVPLVEEECMGVLMVRRSPRSKPFGILDQEILTTLSEQAVVAIRNAQMYETQERVTWGTIRSLSAILEGMDAYSPGQGKSSSVKRLADLALAIADEMKLSIPQQKSLQYAAMLHDAGRVGIPEQILHKTTKLEPAEYARIKEHPVKGASFLEPLETLEPAVPIILYHHERYDGTGYPRGLKKDAIPLGARILGLANAFEAMVSERPYRRAMSVAEAAREIASHSGTQFDPKVVEAFKRLVDSGRIEALL
ncbi:MAG: HD domain-containing protein [Candidatus Omnitrophica bacterium]|nr:HD domain-containing protein [Candidatus Omnitrophota bacterium]